MDRLFPGGGSMSVSSQMPISHDSKFIARRGCYKIPRLEKCPIPSFGIDVMRPATYNPSTQTAGTVLTKQCELFTQAG